MRNGTLPIFVICLAFVGCSRLNVYDVSQIGPDTYSVSASASQVAGGSAGAEAAALKEANAFCQKKAQEILVLNTVSRGGFPDRAMNVTFRCVQKTDSQPAMPTSTR